MEQQRDTVELRPHHLAVIAGSLFRKEGEKIKGNPEYGPGFLDSIEGLCQSLINNPQQKIKIVSGLDDICNYQNPVCGKKKIECSSRNFSDNLCSEDYKLETGRVYEMSEILTTIKGYKEKQDS